MRTQTLIMEPTLPKFGYHPVTGEWNDSLRGDYLWSSVNFGEAVPDVMTPITWSLLWICLHITPTIHFPGGHPPGGNIAGRLYFNLSLISSLYHAVGMDTRKEKIGDLMGATPSELNVAYLPFPPLTVIWHVLPGMIQDWMLTRRDIKQFPNYIASLPEWVRTMRHRVQHCVDPAGLLSLWAESIMPTILRDYRMLRSVTMNLSDHATKLNVDLTTLVGETEARTLLSNLSGPSGDLESLGLLRWPATRCLSVPFPPGARCTGATVSCRPTPLLSTGALIPSSGRRILTGAATRLL